MPAWHPPCNANGHLPILEGGARSIGCSRVLEALEIHLATVLPPSKFFHRQSGRMGTRPSLRGANLGPVFTPQVSSTRGSHRLPRVFLPQPVIEHSLASRARPGDDGQELSIRCHPLRIPTLGKSRILEIPSNQMLTVVEAMDETVVITDPAGIIEYVNPAFEEITGYARAEVLGQSTRILKSGQHSAAFYEEFWSTISRGEVWRGRMINRKKDGTLYEEKATISPVLDEEGRIANYVAVKFDLSREIKLQNELYHAQKMEALGQMAEGITHDFNNILQIILGHVHFVQEEQDPDSQPFADLEKIRLAAESAAELTSRLMAFGRSQINSFEQLQLNPVIEESLTLLRRVLRDNTRLEFTPGAEMPEVTADPNQLQQLILNLALNAQDAMPKGGRIEVSTGTTPASGREEAATARPERRVFLRVKDEGIGMDRATQEHIFDPFFTTKRMGGGTGLGLATVYGIVQQHGGTIQVRSALGEGTEFEILIPLREEKLYGAHTRGG